MGAVESQITGNSAVFNIFVLSSNNTLKPHFTSGNSTDHQIDSHHKRPAM